MTCSWIMFCLFYWQVLASLCLSVCSHQPCYVLLYKKANSLQIFSADKSIHFYTFWCFVFREVHMERLGMKPDVLEIIPRASANCALTINCFEQILPNGRLTDACLLTWVQEREDSWSVVALEHWSMLWLDNGRNFEEGESGGWSWYFESLSVDNIYQGWAIWVIQWYVEMKIFKSQEWLILNIEII